ncbi:MAG: histidine kinase [Lachnospiraceae bacterium]|nr:histidine kinase [Lachnospiraceae bacterium]
MVNWYLAIIPSAVLLVILIILLIFLIRNVRAKKEGDKKIRELENEMSRLSLRLSQNQIRPHFIFNSILAIKQLCIEDPKAAAKALQHFAAYLRSNLDAMSSDELVIFDREIDCIKEYVALEQADPAVHFTVNYDTEFTDFYIPLLVVEPMVENAIRHGISRKGNGVITIRSRLEGNNVVVSVEDNGVGFGNETRQQVEHRSIGIKNAKERLRMLCNGELTIISTGKGTIVRIVIPFEEMDMT